MIPVRTNMILIWEPEFSDLDTPNLDLGTQVLDLDAQITGSGAKKYQILVSKS